MISNEILPRVSFSWKLKISAYKIFGETFAPDILTIPFESPELPSLVWRKTQTDFCWKEHFVTPLMVCVCVKNMRVCGHS